MVGNMAGRVILHISTIVVLCKDFLGPDWWNEVLTISLYGKNRTKQNKTVVFFFKTRKELKLFYQKSNSGQCY